MYHHYCGKCRVFFSCTHPDPEKAVAICPQCKGRLILGHGNSFEELRTVIGMSKSEEGKGEVTYRGMKKEDM